ncbi:membrane protein, partial [gut metagenome]
MEKYYEKRIPNGWLFLLLLLGLAGLGAGVLLDLRLANWIFDPTAKWAMIFAAVANAPAFWGIGAAGFMIIDLLRDKKMAILGWLLGFVMLAIGPI